MAYTIGIIGGTGKEGKGLAYRWAKAGHKVLIGSRLEEKARTAAAELKALLPAEARVEGFSNAAAVEQCDIAVLTVPFAAHAETLQGLKDALQGKILIDVVVPLNPAKATRVSIPPEGSAAQQAQKILGEGVQVVAAFQNIAYEHLLNDESVACDVLVAGTGKEARRTVIGLVQDAGLRGWDAGVIENSVVIEGLTPILIGLNIQHKVSSAGIKITGIPE
ncbi:MAG TPA: NADPH-dependent F420 reductase [Anaerolineaceae bacterium]|jgi:NADPH-dependent F420 reductase|nr:NADPH-dependent F420 reductase [Anaerolineaceae bacterium]